MTNVEIGYRIYMARKENHATLEEVAKEVKRPYKSAIAECGVVRCSGFARTYLDRTGT